MGLLYLKGTNCVLVRQYDYDCFGCKLDCKSTSGNCHLLGNSLVSWN